MLLNKITIVSILGEGEGAFLTLALTPALLSGPGKTQYTQKGEVWEGKKEIILYFNLSAIFFNYDKVCSGLNYI